MSRGRTGPEAGRGAWRTSRGGARPCLCSGRRRLHIPWLLRSSACYTVTPACVGQYPWFCPLPVWMTACRRTDNSLPCTQITQKFPRRYKRSWIWYSTCSKVYFEAMFYRLQRCQNCPWSMLKLLLGPLVSQTLPQDYCPRACAASAADLSSCGAFPCQLCEWMRILGSRVRRARASTWPSSQHSTNVHPQLFPRTLKGRSWIIIRYDCA